MPKHRRSTQCLMEQTVNKQTNASNGGGGLLQWGYKRSWKNAATRPGPPVGVCMWCCWNVANGVGRPWFYGTVSV